MFSPNNPFGLSLSKPSTEPVEVASPSAGRILRLHPERMIFGLALAALAASPAMAGKKRDAERQFYAPSVVAAPAAPAANRSEEHTSELQSLMRISYAVFCLKKKNRTTSKSRRNTARTLTKHKQTT